MLDYPRLCLGPPQGPWLPHRQQANKLRKAFLQSHDLSLRNHGPVLGFLYMNPAILGL